METKQVRVSKQESTLKYPEAQFSETSRSSPSISDWWVKTKWNVKPLKCKTQLKHGVQEQPGIWAWAMNNVRAWDLKQTEHPQNQAPQQLWNSCGSECLNRLWWLSATDSGRPNSFWLQDFLCSEQRSGVHIAQHYFSPNNKPTPLIWEMNYNNPNYSYTIPTSAHAGGSGQKELTAGKPVFCELQTLTAPRQQVKSDKLQRKWFSGKKHQLPLVCMGI